MFLWSGKCPSSNLKMTKMGFSPINKFISGPFFADFCCREGISCFDYFSSLLKTSIIFIMKTFFLFLGFFSRTLTTHRTKGEGRGPSFIPLYHSHLHTNIQTFICNFACEMTITYFESHRLYLLDCYLMRFTPLSNYHLIDWWCDVNFYLFTWWFDWTLFIQQLDMWNRWIRIRIECHPCITSEPTNQVC